VKKFTNKSFILLNLFAVVLFISSCDKTDPLPSSKADFKVTSIAPEVDVPVQFENLSLNSSVYAWDFGDGFKDSITIDPMHTYDSPGSYTVKLTAYTQDGQKSESLQDIDIGERYLTGMYIMNISMKDENGNPWDDDGSGPDVLYQLGPQDATTLDDLVFVYIDSLNVGQFSTPVGITDQDLIPTDYKLSNKDFFILLEEIDSLQDGTADFVPMVDIGFNPVIPTDEFITVTKRENGTGDITIPFAVIQEFQFFLEFEIR